MALGAPVASRRYPVLDSIARMPRWVWEDDSLVI